jgi:3-methyladenine DNA glycosylase AlkC
MTALKDLYSPAFYDYFLDQAKQVLPNLDKKKFIKDLFNKDWTEKELKQRTRHTTEVLHQFMPKDFEKASVCLIELTEKLKSKNLHTFIYGFIFLADYVEVYGLHHYAASVRAMEHITTFISCEFAVRPFILKYEKEMLGQLLLWSTHSNEHVRRLASEGSRPRLPWAMALPAFKKNPSSNLPLLENLKYDSSEYVRRSVANHLNDISKDHPALVIELAKQWKGISIETDTLLKHACRTLLKQGNKEVLKIFGIENKPHVVVTDFNISTPQVNIGKELYFVFSIENRSHEEIQLRIEYAIYYLRQNASHSKKVFKHSERTLKPQEKLTIEKKHSFRVITTRTFYVGTQQLSIIINGHEHPLSTFELKNK